MILEELYNIIEDRKKKMPEGSYIASLFRDGNDRIVQKVGEEAIEVVVAGKGKNKKRIVEEVADLYFMTLILLVAQNISLQDILNELERRRKRR